MTSGVLRAKGLTLPTHRKRGAVQYTRSSGIGSSPRLQELSPDPFIGLDNPVVLENDPLYHNRVCGIMGVCGPTTEKR